jgi:large subunit ribosomal protein L23
MNQEKILTVLLAPHTSEKSTICAEQSNQFVFKVRKDATKAEVSAAVSLMFDTSVEKVTVLNVKGKEKRHGRHTGKRQDWKKAYVTLPEGKEIDFTQG